MDEKHDDAYASFEEDHRSFGAPKREFSPSLRRNTIVAMVAAGVLFCSGLFYLVAAQPADFPIEYLALAG